MKTRGSEVVKKSIMVENFGEKFGDTDVTGIVIGESETSLVNVRRTSLPSPFVQGINSQSSLFIVKVQKEPQKNSNPQGPAGLAVNPLDLHLVNVGSIPTGPTHGEGRLQPHPGDGLKSTPNVRKSPRSGLNLEGRLSDPQIFKSTRC